MLKTSIVFLAFISVFSAARANPTPPQAAQTVNLFVCDTENGKQYAASMDQFPGKCTKAPEMPSDWHPLLIGKDNTSVIYLDIKHVKWNDRVAEVALVIIPFDSSKAVFKDASSIPQFDVLSRKYFYCDKAQQQSFVVELYRNFRKNPELIKRFENANRPLAPVGSSNTADGAAFALVCNHEYEKLITSQASPK